MRVTLQRATPDNTLAIVMIRAAVGERLTRDFGQGSWSFTSSEKGVLYSMRNSNVFVARRSGKIVGVLELGIKKPWAIDKSYFSLCQRPLYLTGMAVTPELQRWGLGRAMLQDVRRIARAWPADAIRLDAYDATAGAGEFYVKCGFQEMGRVTYRKVPLIYYEMLLPTNNACQAPR